MPCRIATGLQSNSLLGNFNARRDWGFAPEYCEGMWQILQYKNAEDFVLATGETHTVREFTETAFNEIGIELEWIGKEENERGIIKNINLDKAKSLIGNEISCIQSKVNFSYKLSKKSEVVAIDPNYYRPTEVELLIGNPSKARELLGWEAKTKFKELVSVMIKADLAKVIMRGY